MPDDRAYIAGLNRQIDAHPMSFRGRMDAGVLELHRRAYPIDTHFDAISGCFQFGADFGAETFKPVCRDWKQRLALTVAPLFMPKGHNRPLTGHANREGFLLGMGGAVSPAHANPHNILGNRAGDPWPLVRAEHDNLAAEAGAQPGTRLCATADEARRAKTEGAPCLIFGLEGVHALGPLPKPGAPDAEESRARRLANLAALKSEFHAACITLDHYCATDASRAGMVGNPWLAWSRRTRDLTGFGRQVVTRAFDLGLLVDLAHTATAPLLAVCAMAQARGVPVIATHSGSRRVMQGMRAAIRREAGRAVRPNRRTARMLEDECIRQIVATGGAIGVIFGTQFLVNMRYRDFTGANDAPLSVLLEHYECLANLIAHLCPDADPWAHLCLGTDFDGALASIPWEIRGARDFPLVTLAMLERGWPQARIEAVYSENFLRVWSEAENARL